jgi:hypothetical protein
LKARWADPVVREKTISEIRAAMADPTVRQKLASASKKTVGRPLDARKDHRGQ